MAHEPTGEAGDCFALLKSEHARIELRLQALDQAAVAIRKDERDRTALGVVAETLRYFAAEGVVHEQHEESTLFPRLQPFPEFKQILSALQFQHRMNDTEARALAACLERVAPGNGRELARQAVRFAEAHRGHMFAEERALFPAAAAKLAPEVVAAMTREVQERDEASRRKPGR